MNKISLASANTTSMFVHETSEKDGFTLRGIKAVHRCLIVHHGNVYTSNEKYDSGSSFAHSRLSAIGRFVASLQPFQTLLLCILVVLHQLFASELTIEVIDYKTVLDRRIHYSGALIETTDYYPTNTPVIFQILQRGREVKPSIRYSARFGAANLRWFFNTEELFY